MENRPTPQEQVENMLSGISHTYKVVAKRHVHPWYSWALLAASLGFAIGVTYVANQKGKFDASMAARIPEQYSEQRVVERLFDLSYREFNEIFPNITSGAATLTIKSEKKNFDLGAPQQKTALKAQLVRLEAVKTPYELSIAKGPTYYVGIKDRISAFGSMPDPISCFDLSRSTQASKSEEGSQEEYEFDDGKYYVQGNLPACVFTSLVNMNIDVFGVDVSKEMNECAKKRGIIWTDGADQNERSGLLSCKLLALAKLGKKASFYTNNFALAADPSFNDPENKKSPCKEIAETLKNGGGATIFVNSSNASRGHMSQVHGIDCKSGKLTLNDPNGLIIKLGFDKDGAITSVEPEEAAELFSGTRILSYTAESKK